LANAEWTVVSEGGTGTRGTIDLYDNPKWAKPYDVVIHNACFADTDSPEYIRKITKAHYKGVPAVVIHCAMHTYRAAKIDDWREFLGVTSLRHDHQSIYPLKKVDLKHPILKDVPDGWVPPKDELYIIEKVWPNTKTLATAVSEEDGKAHPVVWTNKYGKAKVFGTTYGHHDAMFEDPVYLNMVSRGILWAAGRLKD
jgi:type 1 glutamine amidotransferase